MSPHAPMHASMISPPLPLLLARPLLLVAPHKSLSNLKVTVLDGPNALIGKISV